MKQLFIIIIVVLFTTTVYAEPSDLNPLPEQEIETEPIVEPIPTRAEPIPSPKVIVESYIINPSEVTAGEEFTAIIKLKNTSNKSLVQNMTVDVSVDSQNFLLLNDSATIFVGSIYAGATKEIELNYRVDNDTTAQKYNVTLTISYDDTNAMSLNSTGMITVTVKQPLNVKIDSPTIASQVEAGDTIPFSIQAMNLGRSEVYNVRMVLSAPGLFPTGTVFIGNMEPGTSGNGTVDVFVGTKNMSQDYDGDEKYGLTTGTITMIYEDSQGNEFNEIINISTTINKPVIETQSNQQGDKPKMASQWWISVFIGIIVIISLVFFIIVRKK